MTFSNEFLKIYDRKINIGEITFRESGIPFNDFMQLCTVPDFVMEEEVLARVCERMKMTAEENERSRYVLYKNGSGKKRLKAIIDELENIRTNFDNPANNDAFYGKVDCLLTELDEIMSIYKNTK